MVDETRRLDRDHTALIAQRQIEVSVVAGPDMGKRWGPLTDSITVGTAQQNSIVLTDSSVSRHHLRIDLTPEGFLIDDLDSTNGTYCGSMKLLRGIVAKETEIRVGDSVVRIQPLKDIELFVPKTDHFGEIYGKSDAMLQLFAQMEQLAKHDVAVLVEGETGTGKELIARELHRHSRRKNGPFVVVDCGAVAPSLIESELFGHMRGAFTGAVEDRPGAFEEASGGTIFLDEIGELDLSLQPRLLRVLQEGQTKRLGESKYRNVDVRIVSATNRDLKRCVNQNTFRADLYYRLATTHLRVPPLRDRKEDVSFLAERLLPQVAAEIGVDPQDQFEEILSTLKPQLNAHRWPGNIRELRNALARALTLPSGAPISTATSDPKTSSDRLEGLREDAVGLPFKQAKAQYLATFEKNYIAAMLDQTEGNVSEAARRSGIDRVHLHRLIKKYL